MRGWERRRAGEEERRRGRDAGRAEFLCRKVRVFVHDQKLPHDMAVAYTVAAE